MSQNVELATVKAKIKKMAAMTVDNGATEGQMEFAFQQIGKLLAQYNITMADVDVRDEPCVTVEFDSPANYLKNSIAVGIGRFTSCQVWTHSTYRKGKLHKTIKFFGMESDADMALYLCNLINRMYGNEWNKFKKSEVFKNAPYGGRDATKSFKAGLEHRMYIRLCEMADEILTQETEEAERRQKVYANMGPGTGLVVTKDNRVEQEFKKLGLKLRFSRSSRSNGYNSKAFDAGKASANTFNLNRPVGGSGQAGYFIGKH